MILKMEFLSEAKMFVSCCEVTSVGMNNISSSTDSDEGGSGSLLPEDLI